MGIGVATRTYVNVPQVYFDSGSGSTNRKHSQKEKSMTAKKVAPVTPPAPKSKIEQMRDDLMAEAAKDPSIIALANKVFVRTVKWADKVGMGPRVKKTASGLGIPVGKQLDFMADSGNWNSNQLNHLKTLFEVVIGEPAVTTKLGGSTSKLKYENGVAVKITKKVNDHSYPFDEAVIIVDYSTLRGVTSSGVTPTPGSHIEIDPSALAIPTEPEILACLASIFVLNPAVFVQISAF
jgi:hypothetical protein